MPADRVSTQVLPLADSLSAAVDREKYHKYPTSNKQKLGNSLQKK